MRPYTNTNKIVSLWLLITIVSPTLNAAFYEAQKLRLYNQLYRENVQWCHWVPINQRILKPSSAFGDHSAIHVNAWQKWILDLSYFPAPVYHIAVTPLRMLSQIVNMVRLSAFQEMSFIAITQWVKSFIFNSFQFPSYWPFRKRKLVLSIYLSLHSIH